MRKASGDKSGAARRANKPQGADDFRSRRARLPKSAFAMVQKGRLRVDLIDREVWRGIQALPDDVALRTSEYYGGALRMQYELWSDWVEEVLAAPDGSLESDTLARVTLDVADEWQAATFASLHGFYRQAVATLRAALERTVIAARYQGQANDPAFVGWLEGRTEIHFQATCNELLSRNAKVQSLNQRLQEFGLGPFVEQRKNGRAQGWVGDLWGRLCRYDHCRPGNTHGDLWGGSNGPILDARGFSTTAELFLETSTACWILAKAARPALQFPAAAEVLLKLRGRGWRQVARCAYRFLVEIVGRRPESLSLITAGPSARGTRVTA